MKKDTKGLIKKLIIAEIKSQLNEKTASEQDFKVGPYPWANMNGNTSDQIIEGAYELEAAADKFKTLIARYDGFHGRNGLDSTHRNALQDKRKELISSINTIQKYFTDIIDLYM